MENMYNVSASPHVRSKVTTSSIMRDVCIALLPACLFGVYRFGVRAAIILILSVLSCVITELVYFKMNGKKYKTYECSAIVTGLLLGMNLPATVPYWIPVVGGIFAILVVKQLFGGLGQNFMNPALAARCFLLLCFATQMSSFGIEKGSAVFNGAAAVDGISGPTPLAMLKAGETINLKDAFFGFTGGTIGEVSACLILVGAIYLLIRKVITFTVPVTYILTFAVFALLFGGHGFDINYVLCELCTGGLMLGAWFMATDYVTCPVTKIGRIVYGVVLGILTGVFRIYGNNAEGVSFAIIIANTLVPLIEKNTLPKPFGMKGGSKRA